MSTMQEMNEQNIKPVQPVMTEKPTWSFPGGRQTMTTFNNPQTLQWVIDIPAGKMIAGFIIDAKLVTVGAAMSLTRISQIFKSIQIFGDGKLTGTIDQYTLSLLPIALGWARHNDDYANVGVAQHLLGRRVVQDDINVADGATMYGYWNIPFPCKGSSQIKIQAQLYNMQQVFGAGMTSGVPSISIVPVFANVGARKQYNLFAQQLSDITRVAYKGIAVGAFFVDAEWNTISNSMQLGGKLTVEQVYAMQSEVGNTMNLWAPVEGAAVDGRLTTIEDPTLAADTYVLADKFDGSVSAIFTFLSTQTIKAIVLSEASPDNIEVQ